MIRPNNPTTARPRATPPSTIGSVARLMGVALALLLLSLVMTKPLQTAAGPAGVIIEDVSPDNSDLDPPGSGGDPDGASGGRVNGLATVSDDNQVFYAASEWGGLFKTEDGGDNWTRLNGHLPVVTWDVEVDPGNTGTVYATSWYDGRVNSISGIEVSYDAGVTWSQPASATAPAAFNCAAARRTQPEAFGIGIRPDAPQNVFIGTSCGVARSTDSGLNWTFLDPTPATTASTVWDVVVQAGGTNGIVDVCGDDRHRRSTDGGATWSNPATDGVDNDSDGTTDEAGEDTTLPQGRCSIAVSPDEPYVLFVYAADNNIYESDDAGATWTNLGTPDTRRQGRIPFVATNQRPDSGGNDVFDLWVGDVSLFRTSCTTPAAPAQGGANRCTAARTGVLQIPGKGPPAGWAGPFTRCNDPDGNACAHDDVGDIVFDIDPAVAGNACPLLFSSDGGVYYNTDTGGDCHDPNWEEPTVTPHALWLWSMSGADAAGDANEFLYFGTQDNGSWGTTNAGAGTPTWHNQDCCDVFDVVAEAGQVIYDTCCGITPTGFTGTLRIGTPGMASSAAVATQPPGNVPVSFAFPDVIDTFGPNQYVITTSTGTFITNDITASPTTWTQIGAASDPGGTAVQAAVSGGTPTFYVQVGNNVNLGNQVWKYSGTSPSGTWQRIDNNDGLTGGLSIFAVDPTDPNRLYASNLAPGGPQIVFSTDGGLTWENDFELDNLMQGVVDGTPTFRYQTQTVVGKGLGQYVQPSLLGFDPEDPNILVAGGQDSGVFVSTDGGENWGLVTDPFDSANSGVPHIPRPYYAYFDHEPAGEAKIYIGTQGRGVWRLTLPTADLSITKTDSPDPVKGGDNLFYRISVANDGPDTAPDVRVIVTLPDDVKFVKDDLDACTGDKQPAGTLACELGDLTAGASATVTLRVTVNALKTSLQNTAEVLSPAALDPDPTNNTATIGTIVKTCKPGQPETDNQPPTVSGVVIGATRLEGKPVTFTANATDNCDSPENLHYKWTFSDGGVAFGSQVSHVFLDDGSYSASVRVTDKAGNEARRNVSLSVANQNPVVSPLAVPPKVSWGVPIQFSGSATDPSPIDQATLEFRWDFDDGTSALNQKVSHAFAAPDSYNVTLTVTDKDGGSASAARTVAVNKRVTNIKYDGPISVAANDPVRDFVITGTLVDHVGDPVKGRVLQFIVTAPNGEVLEASNSTDGNGKARVSIQPPLDLSGEIIRGGYQVEVVFKDGDPLYEPSAYKKTITVLDNRPPVISPLPTGIKAPWGVPIEFSGFATDPDGSDPGTLKYVWDFGDGTPVQINQKVTHAFPPPPEPATLPHDYTVTLTVTDKDGASTMVQTDVTINKRPTTIENCGETQIVQSANKIELCARLLVADIDGGDSDAGVKGKALQFQITDMLNKLITSSETDAKGETRPTLMVIVAAGCYPGRIEFKGDELYEGFEYNYVFYTVGAGRITGPVQQCSLSVSSSGFALLDSDGDGCSNGEESGSVVWQGGQRDPQNSFDFYTVPIDGIKDNAVTVGDIFQIALRFGSTGDSSGSILLGPVPEAPAYHTSYDRTPAGPEVWNLGPPDGSISVQDIFLAAAQFGHACA